MSLLIKDVLDKWVGREYSKRYYNLVQDIEALTNYDESVFIFIKDHKLTTYILYFFDSYFGKELDAAIIIKLTSKYNLDTEYLEYACLKLARISTKSYLYAKKYKDFLPDYIYEEMIYTIETSDPFKWITDYVQAKYTYRDRLLHHMPQTVFEYCRNSIKNDIYTLHRGLSFSSKSQLREWYNREISGGSSSKIVVLNSETITSWTTEKERTEEFSFKKFSCILTAIIPKKYILVDIQKTMELIDPYYSYQKEILVLPGQYKCEIKLKKESNEYHEATID